MVGHSKGGHEARVNAFATGMNAILFNPATTTWRSTRRNGIPDNDVRNYGGNMTTYIVEGDVLHNIFGFITDHEGTWGTLIMLERQYSSSGWRIFSRIGDSGRNHSMVAVLAALAQRYSFNDDGGMCE